MNESSRPLGAADQPALFEAGPPLELLQRGAPWPDPQGPLLPGSPTRCARPRPAGDPIYDLCDRVLDHDGRHAQVRFVDDHPRYLVQQAWAADSPTLRSQWLHYRQQTQALRDRADAGSLHLEQVDPDDVEQFERALGALTVHAVPTWEQWSSPQDPIPPDHAPGAMPPAANSSPGPGFAL